MTLRVLQYLVLAFCALFRHSEMKIDRDSPGNLPDWGCISCVHWIICWTASTHCFPSCKKNLLLLLEQFFKLISTCNSVFRPCLVDFLKCTGLFSSIGGGHEVRGGLPSRTHKFYVATPNWVHTTERKNSVSSIACIGKLRIMSTFWSSLRSPVLPRLSWFPVVQTASPI